MVILSNAAYESERKSSIVTVGLSIHNCPVEIREKMAVPAEAWNDAVAELCAYPHIEEAGILSTCNRMEIYVVALSYERGLKEVEEWMVKHSGVDVESLREHLFVLKDRESTGHLVEGFRWVGFGCDG